MRPRVVSRKIAVEIHLVILSEAKDLLFAAKCGTVSLRQSFSSLRMTIHDGCSSFTNIHHRLLAVYP